MAGQDGVKVSFHTQVFQYVRTKCENFTCKKYLCLCIKSDRVECEVSEKQASLARLR